MSACAQCGAQLTYRGGRRPKYCSLRCEKRAQRARVKAREQAEALDRALAAVTLAEHALRRAKAARAALDGEPDPLDRHAYRSFEGSEWLASKRGAFGPSLDTEAAAEAIRQRFEGEQRAQRIADCRPDVALMWPGALSLTRSPCKARACSISGANGRGPAA